ncbi:tetratricopeptide repeat protein [Aquimarina latercula]|uniref:tetratricopeptide repeat protein n=1 Tax=Aquimarina latercula TaxID=987 RepID=UPI000413142C|nr:tetratricopeptide repeat protein [Aquimarina latercula]
MKDYPIEIDDYLSGNMSTSEKQAFEARLLTDTELSEELKLQQDMQTIYEDQKWVEGNKDALKTTEATQLKAFYQSDEAATLKSTINEVISENRSNSQSKTFWFIGIAASIAVLITVSLFVFKETNYDELYASYIHLDEIPSLVTRGEDTNKMLEDAQLLFEEQKYQKATELFTTYHQKEKSIDPLSYIYNGISYVELNKFDEALSQFQLLRDSNTLQAKKANWYKALVYLKQKDKKELIAVLQTIVSDSNAYKYQEAKELLTEID